MEGNEKTEKLLEWLDEKDDFYDTTDVPSWELLAAAGDIFKHLLNDSLSQTKTPTTDDVKSMACGALMLAEHAEFKQMAVKTFALTLSNLDELVADFPAIAPRIIGITLDLMASAQCVIAGNALARHKNFAARIDPFVRQHAVKAAVKDRAQTIATELWKADTAKAIRIGGMADKVYRQLVGEGFAKSLPGSAERIKEWIKPAAPDYARKGGKPRKTP